jgi:cytochrome c oxidase subunit II
MKRRLGVATIALSLSTLSASLLAGPPSSTRHIQVAASRFSFEPSEITVKKGEPVTITFKSKDVTHGLVIEDLGVRREIKKGRPQDLTLVPETTGTFEGRCAHFCGKGHASMVFTIHVVEPNDEIPASPVPSRASEQGE